MGIWGSRRDGERGGSLGFREVEGERGAVGEERRRH